MPTKYEILKLLDKLDYHTADELETEELEFKPWRSPPKNNQTIAAGYAVCFANAKGGTIVFGVHDRVVGRRRAIHGCNDYTLDLFKNAVFQATTPSIRVDLEELRVPEGTLLLVQVPPAPPNTTHGTVDGFYRIIDIHDASEICQREPDEMKRILDDLSSPTRKLLEKRGGRRGTYHLDRAVAVDLLGKARYSQLRDIEAVRFPEMIRQYVAIHGSINNKECRELLKLGDSPSAIVSASQILKELSGDNGFLEPVEGKRKNRRYIIRPNSVKH